MTYVTTVRDEKYARTGESLSPIVVYHRVFILSLQAERKNGFSVHDPPSISASLNRVKLPLGLIKGTNGQGLVSSHYTLIPV